MASLLDFFGGVVAQINPFDGGEDYNSVMRRRREQEAQQPARPRPTVVPGQPQGVRALTMQGAQSPERPQQPSLPRVTAANISQNSVVKQTQPNPLKTAGDFVNENVVKPFTDAINKQGTAYARGITTIGNEITGQNDAERQEMLNERAKALKSQFQASQIRTDGPTAPGLLQQRANLLRESQRAQNTANLIQRSRDIDVQAVRQENDPIKVGAAGLNIATTVAAPTMGRLANFIAQKAAPAVGNLGGRVIGGAVSQVPTGAVFGASGQLQETGAQTRPEDLLTSTAIGAASGGVLGGAMPLLGAAGRRLMNPSIQQTNPVNPGQMVQNGTLPQVPGKAQGTVTGSQMPIRSQSFLPKNDSSLIPSVPQRLSTKEQPRSPQAQTQEQLSNSYRNNTIPSSMDGNNLLQPPAIQKSSRYATKTIPQSPYIGQRLRSQVKANAPTYTPETERGRYNQTLKSADQMGFDEFENDVARRLQDRNINSQTVVDSQTVAQRLEAKGDDNSLRRAAEIYDQLSSQLTKSGQTVQAAAILARRTPDGMKYQALKDLRKAGVEPTPEIQRKINDLANRVSKTKPGSDERKVAIGTLAKEVEKNIPNGAVSNLVSVWKAGLLTGVKTTQGNIISNATFAGLKKASDPLTVMTDKLLSLGTGKRTVTATGRGSIKGTKEGFKKGYQTLKTGIDTRENLDKYETRRGINFKNKAVQNFLGVPAQKVFDFLGSQDQPFYFSQLKNSLYDQAKAEGINKGLRGKQLSRFMDETVNNPNERMLQTATNDAAKSVLGYDTIGYKAIRGIHRGIDNFEGGSNLGKQTAHAVVDVLAPFVRVPTAFLSRTLDYTPIGISKEIISQIAKKEFDQRALSKSIGEGLTGTGAIALGTMLAKNGQLSGDYPDDPKEQERWRAEGIQPNSIKLGDKWLALNYLGPLALLFGAGKRFQESVDKSEGLGTASVQAAAGFGQTLLGQSFLQGFSGFSDAIQDPQRELKSFLNSQVASLVPNIVNDISNLTDSYKRQVNNPQEAVMNKIPGLRQGLNPKQDVYGNELTQNPLDTLSAFKPSSQPGTSVTEEVSRLANLDKDNKDLQVTPTQVDKNLKINDTTVNLTDQQRYDLQKQVGQATQDAWSKLIESDKYKALSDVDKAKSLTKLREDVSSVAQRQYVEDNNLAAYDEKLSKREKKIANGNLNVDSYAKEDDGKDGNSIDISDNVSGESRKVLEQYDELDDDERKELFRKTNDAEYKYRVAKYENDVALGKLSAADKVNTSTELAKAKIGSAYSKDIRELYGLSKNEISSYLETEEKGVDKAKLAEELYAYDRALYDAGLSSSLKYKYGFAARGKGGGRGKGGKKGNGVTEGRSMVNLISSLNKIRVPQTTGSKPPAIGLRPPQMKRPVLKKYIVKKNPSQKIKTSKA